MLICSTLAEMRYGNFSAMKYLGVVAKWCTSKYATTTVKRAGFEPR